MKLGEKKVGQYRLYMAANELANVRRDILKANRLVSAEREEIKRTARKLPISDKQNPEDL